MTQQSSKSGPQDGGHSSNPKDRTAAWLVGGIGSALEAAGLLVLALLSVRAVLTGHASTATRGSTEAVVLAVLAVGVALLAKNLLQRRSLARTPTLVWNVMLLPVSYSLFGGGAPVWGIVTGTLAFVTLVAAALVPRYELEDDGRDSLA